MSGGLRRLLLSDVSPGDEVPVFAYDVTATTVVLGALATRDWRPMHHDRDFAQKRNGVQDIFLNTPNQAAWFERYVEDWTGPTGRLGRMKFRMRDSVFPGARMTFHGRVEKAGTDETGCGWLELALELRVGEKTMTECRARVAVPVAANDNPWARKGDDWKP
jgi:acyl dehydratase